LSSINIRDIKFVFMKIFKITKFYHPRIGGVERHISEISDILTKKGFDITVITEKYNNILKNEESIKAFLPQNKIFRIALYLGLAFSK